MLVLKTLATVFFVGAAAVANAVPVHWNLSGVEFDDGGTASGSFSYDSATNTYSAINITTTAGSVLPGTSYGDPHPTAAWSSAGRLLTVGHTSATDLTGLPLLALAFVAPLSDLGGTVGIAIGGLAGDATESTCINSTCANFSNTYRTNLAGGVVSTISAPPPGSVPTPGVLSLLGLGLAGLGYRRKQVKAA